MILNISRQIVLLTETMEGTIFSANYTLEHIELILQKFWAVAESHPVIAFSGDMGAGKTTFIHRLCDYLTVQDAVSSPTFALINEYHFSSGNTDKTIFHMDWYRLKDDEEAISAGMEDCLLQTRRGNIYCFIEWPEKAVSLLRMPHLWVSIQTLSSSERHMEVNIRNI